MFQFKVSQLSSYNVMIILSKSVKLLQFTNKHTFNCEAQLTLYKIFSVQRDYESSRSKGLNEDS